MARIPGSFADMPDWFYRTAAQPILFALPARTGRAIALGLLGALGKHAGGRRVIDFLGHAEADPRLKRVIAGTEYGSPFGLGWRVDPERRATQALLRFGVGCIEVHEQPRDVQRCANNQLIDGDALSLKGTERIELSGPILRRRFLAGGTEVLELPSGDVLPVVAGNEVEAVVGCSTQEGVVLQIGERVSEGQWRVPLEAPAGFEKQVRAWRQVLPESAPLIVAGGVSEPADALRWLDAGADLVLIESGLVFNGPGLVKRCNEALLSRMCFEVASPVEGNSWRHAWFWSWALGAALFGGGLMTLVLAFSRVLLPYDESYLGLTSATLRQTLPRMFAFMAHDRGTLAGTMLGLGWLYIFLAWFGVRRRVHGARTAVVVSALAGFASFFAFFGFGYFDTLHAFVAAILFQLTVQVMVTATGGGSEEAFPVDREDSRLHRAQWAQLCWIVHAVGLIAAGTVILVIGMTSVFVSEDLAFLCMTAEQAGAMGSKLRGVVAHDRATLGGMLLASGVGMLLPMLWCYRRGAGWLWWANLGLGFPAYSAAIGVHLWVGYNDWRHTVPAFLGLGLWLAGTGLSAGYLLEKSESRQP